jgi:hypothetical protein
LQEQQQQVPTQQAKQVSQQTSIPVTPSPLHFQKTYRRKMSGSTQSVTDSESSAAKKLKIGGLTKEEDPDLQPEAESSKTGKPMIIEVVSTLKEHLSSQSDVQPMKIDSEPFKRFMEIKEKGVEIKQDAFSQMYDPETSHTRMLSAMDFEKGKLNIVVLETRENKRTNITFDLNALHPIDKMDLHRKTREMVNKDIITTTLGMKKLQVMKDNLTSQLKYEKLANEIKMNKIKELEQWVIDLGERSKGCNICASFNCHKGQRNSSIKEKTQNPWCRSCANT